MYLGLNLTLKTKNIKSSLWLVLKDRVEFIESRNEFKDGYYKFPDEALEAMQKVLDEVEKNLYNLIKRNNRHMRSFFFCNFLIKYPPNTLLNHGPALVCLYFLPLFSIISSYQIDICKLIYT